MRYRYYKITLTLKSAISTPFDSDTIWGHMCWALKYVEGESALKDLLNDYDNGKVPLLVSNGLPKGYVIRPLYPLRSADEKGEKKELKKALRFLLPILY